MYHIMVLSPENTPARQLFKVNLLREITFMSLNIPYSDNDLKSIIYLDFNNQSLNQKKLLYTKDITLTNKTDVIQWYRTF